MIDSKWYQIIIVDSSPLPGTSIQRILSILLQVIDFRYVVPDNIFQAGGSFFFQNEESILDIKEVFEELNNFLNLNHCHYLLRRLKACRSI